MPSSVAQAVFAPQHFSIFIQFIIADFKKKKKMKKKQQHVIVPYIPYTITACLRDTMNYAGCRQIERSQIGLV